MKAVRKRVNVERASEGVFLAGVDPAAAGGRGGGSTIVSILGPAGAGGSVEQLSVSVVPGGATPADEAERTAEGDSASAVGGGGPLRPIEIEKRARIIAVKAFVADLWAEWCKLLGDAPPVRAEPDPRRPDAVPADYADVLTMKLAGQARMYEEVQRHRKAQAQRGMDPLSVEMLKGLEDRESAKLTKMLREHALWPWLSQFPGLGGVHVATVVGMMREPRRFAYPKKLFAYMGLHVVNGKLPRRMKNQRCNWSTRMRTACLMPDAGIAAQIVRLGAAREAKATKTGTMRKGQAASKYRLKYEAAKERIKNERGVLVESAAVGDAYTGQPRASVEGGIEHGAVSERESGSTPSTTKRAVELIHASDVAVGRPPRRGRIRLVPKA